MRPSIVRASRGPSLRAAVRRRTIGGVRAMVLERQREPLRLRDLPVPEPGPGEVLLRVLACGVCRTDLHVVDGELAAAEAAARARPPDRRRRTGATARRPRRAVARLDVRHLPLLPVRAREPLRRGALHRLRPRRRLRGVRGRRRALLLPDPRAATRTTAGGAAALRRADRLPLAAPGRRRASGSACTASARRRTSSRRSRGTRAGACSPSSGAGDDAARSVRARARRGVGGRSRRAAAGAARRRDHLRAGRRARAGRAARARRRAAPSSAPGIHMSDIPRSRTSCSVEERVVRSVANLTRRDGEEFLALAPQRAGAHRGRGVPAGAGERGARPPARGRDPRRGGAARLVLSRHDDLPPFEQFFAFRRFLAGARVHAGRRDRLFRHEHLRPVQPLERLGRRGRPQQLTSFTENTVRGVAVRDDGEVLFSADRDGDELTSSTASPRAAAGRSS